MGKVDINTMNFYISLEIKGDRVLALDEEAVTDVYAEGRYALGGKA